MTLSDSPGGYLTQEALNRALDELWKPPLVRPSEPWLELPGPLAGELYRRATARAAEHPGMSQRDAFLDVVGELIGLGSADRPVDPGEGALPQ